MKPKIKQFKGYVELQDYFEIANAIDCFAVFDTLLGCKRALTGYDNLKFGEIEITVKFMPIKDKKK